ncbi:alpha/beta hydrolase [uncultured Flavobacterium sp.]|uniref:alpha/beta hydrolase n=1 Tax=uncultured Flavobacterium sp. TaxID=165435 RepID=UPI0030ED2518
MKKNKNLARQAYFLFMLFILGINIHSYGQDKVISLWKNQIPNEIISTSYQELNTYKNGEIESSSQVSKPTLSLFLPKKTKPNGTAVLIFPGGGYSHLAINKEGTKVAQWLNTMGITAFVLKYRLPSDKIMENKSTGPLQDAQEAIRYIRRNATQLNIDEKRIGVIGFSAGGHLASTLSTNYNEQVYNSIDSTSARPNFSILIYPVVSMNSKITHLGSQVNLLGKSASSSSMERFSNDLQITSETPETFIVHASDDTVVSAKNSINYYKGLIQHHVPVELHLYEKGGHGFGLGKDQTSQYWTADCQNWLKNHQYIN